jgi:inosine/xanthosine triphosphate pyrophosphatase family protein
MKGTLIVTLLLKTSNARKLAEFRRFGLNLNAQPGEDLPEVQGTPEQVAIYKALAAGEGVLVEDTSLDVEGFDIGVNIRWLMETLASGLRRDVADGIGPRAVWRVSMAYFREGVMNLSTAEITGHMLVQPRGEGFSFDRFFVPDGHALTLAELDQLGLKDGVSARKRAVEQLLNGQGVTRPVADIPEWTGAYQAVAA